MSSAQVKQELDGLPIRSLAPHFLLLKVVDSARDKKYSKYDKELLSINLMLNRFPQIVKGIPSNLFYRVLLNSVYTFKALENQELAFLSHMLDF